jgi:hypothetical protein
VQGRQNRAGRLARCSINPDVSTVFKNGSISSGKQYLQKIENTPSSVAGTHRNISPVVQKSCHGHRSSPRSIASQGRHFPGLLGRTIELPAPVSALLSAF